MEKEEKKEDTKKEDKAEDKKEEKKDEDKKDNKVEDKKEDKKEEKKEDKQDTKIEDKSNYSIELRIKALEEENSRQKIEIDNQKIKNAIFEKIDDKDLQKAVIETGLVKSVDDIDKVVKIVELSQSINKSKFKDGYKPADTAKTDTYEQAEAKKDILGMIKSKLNKQQ